VKDLWGQSRPAKSVTALTELNLTNIEDNCVTSKQLDDFTILFDDWNLDSSEDGTELCVSDLPQPVFRCEHCNCILAGNALSQHHMLVEHMGCMICVTVNELIFDFGMRELCVELGIDIDGQVILSSVPRYPYLRLRDLEDLGVAGKSPKVWSYHNGGYYPCDWADRILVVVALLNFGHTDFVICGGESNPGPVGSASEGDLQVLLSVDYRDDTSDVASDVCCVPKDAAYEAHCDLMKERSAFIAPTKGKRDKLARRDNKSQTPSTARSSVSKGVQRPKGSGGSPKFGQARAEKFSFSRLADQVESYHLTEAYNTARKAGVKDEESRQRFNRFVRDNIRKIDPSVAVVCMEDGCGKADLYLCKHCIVNRGVEAVEEGGFIVPTGQNNFTWRTMIADGIRSWFAWPKFEMEVVNNHNLAGFTNDQLGDSDIITECYNYVKMNQHTTYVIAGKFDREAKLAHSKKLATQWLDVAKVPLDARTETRFVNIWWHTVQRVSDQAEVDMLVAYTDPTHNWVFHFALTTLKQHWKPVVIVGGLFVATSSPTVRGWTMSAVEKAFRFSALAQLKELELVSQTGSQLVLLSVEHTYNTAQAMVRGIFHGVAYHFFGKTL